MYNLYIQIHNIITMLSFVGYYLKKLIYVFL